MPVPTTQYFALGGSTLPAESMLEARAGHICVALPDDTVLVAGGIDGSNLPTNSAEIFHPDTGRWSFTGAMLAPRTGASAVLLADGRALVVGGQTDGQPARTLEIYNPARGRFEPVAGILSVPRKACALTVLEDERVLIAGGTGPDGMVLDTTDILEPGTDRVLPGPRMLSPRTSFSASRLLDGKVLVAGGSDGSTELASAEIFDPEANEFSSTAPLRTARQGHLAVVVPNNGRVLLAGGFRARQPVQEAEVFVPWRGAFEAAVASAGRRQGEVVAIGSLNGDGKLVSTRTYVSPSIVFTDSGIAGVGWAPGEQVKLYDAKGAEATAVADGNGRIAAAFPAPARYVFARGATHEAGARRY
jgi:hypothetical protein